MNVENSVRERYTDGARERQQSLCCPVSYDSSLLDMLPDEIIDKDYGCGDPSRYVKQGDTVLDLGSGGGKICYMAAQLVGQTGSVIGVDMNDDMLTLARKYQQEMAARLCGNRVNFVKGNIQDLALNVEALDEYLQKNPVRSAADYAALRLWESSQCQDKPLIQDQSIDLVISNCVLNLVADEEKQQLVREIYRVLKPGGRVAISDIVSDREIPQHMKNDPELWSGCLSGAFRESEFLDEFVAAGFGAVCYDKWDADPWQVIEGIEFRSVTLTATRPDQADDGTDNKSVMYRGPFATVTDDAGNSYARGQRVALTGSTHRMLLSAYDNAFIDLSAESELSESGCCAATLDASGDTSTEVASGSSRGNSCC